MSQLVDIKAIEDYLLNLQESITQQLINEDPAVQVQDDFWKQKTAHGGGKTRVIHSGKVIEQGGVNYSHVYGKGLPPSATERRPDLAGGEFEALGVSMILHTQNPYVPAMHANVRFFIAQKAGCEPLWWFGGGFDLTPYYPYEEDCVHWHKTAKKACDPFGKETYAEFKQACDNYFYLKHRQEPRGIGGLFFDDLNRWDFATCFEFMKSIGDHIMPAYLPIMQARKNLVHGRREKEFQLYRRGRYAEFNLVYDRGTQFGLQSQGRTESILISMPPQAAWRYNWQPEPGTPEAELYDYYLKPKDWLAEA